MKKILLFILLLIILSGCTTIKVNKELKLSEENVIKYVNDYLEDKYQKSFEIELIEKEEMTLGDNGKIHNIKDCFKYRFSIDDKDGVEFTLVYIDPYFVKKGNDIEYHEAIISESYTRTPKYIIYQYLDKNEIVKFDSIQVEQIFDGFESYTTKRRVYLNYDINSISNELIFKLLNIKIDGGNIDEIVFLNNSTVYGRFGWKLYTKNL